MSDKVAFAVGNTFQRDHVCWPTQLHSQVEANNPGEIDTLWQKKVNLSTIMALVWRVKTWKFGGEFSYSASGAGGAQIHTIDATIDEEEIDVPLRKSIDPLITATRERDILGNAEGFNGYTLANAGHYYFSAEAPVAYTGTATNSPDWSSEDSGANPVSIRVQLFAPGAVIIYDPSDQTFQPWLKIEGSFTRGPFQITFRAQRSTDPFPTTATGIIIGELLVRPLIVPDFTIPMAIRGFQSGVGGPFLHSGSITLTLEATEFWPFANSLGAPVWDSATGGQINSPFS